MADEATSTTACRWLPPALQNPPSNDTAPFLAATPPNVDPRERALAEQVSAPAKAAPQSPRSLYHILIGLRLFRGAEPPTPEQTAAARMQGLRPLGADTILAMPTVPYNEK
jgi:hypothetical protein